MLRSRSGFTMIEMMVVVIVVGILASLALPHLQASRNKANLASVKNDLSTVQTAEEEYFSDHNTYGTLAQLEGSTSIKISANNTVTITVGGTGYALSATNAAIQSGPATCTVNMGATAGVQGVVSCP
jgi:type IV pilus assembly protein PilA